MQDVAATLSTRVSLKYVANGSSDSERRAGKSTSGSLACSQPSCFKINFDVERWLDSSNQRIYTCKYASTCTEFIVDLTYTDFIVVVARTEPQFAFYFVLPTITFTLVFCIAHVTNAVPF